MIIIKNPIQTSPSENKEKTIKKIIHKRLIHKYMRFMYEFAGK